MIERLFLGTVEVSLATGVVISLLVLCSAGIGRRYGAGWKYWIWLVIAIRMLIPLNADLSFGRLNLAVWEELSRVSVPEVFDVIPEKTGVESMPEAELTGTVVTEHRKPAEPAVIRKRRLSVLEAASLIWLCGACALFGVQFIGYLRFRRSILRSAKEAEDERLFGAMDVILHSVRRKRKMRIFLLDAAISPMLIGFVRPFLLLPDAEYSREELGFILKHELTHYRRHDNCYKLLLVAVRSLHWFNPLVWLFVRQAMADLELSCDEAVVANEPYAVRKAYTETLLAALSRQCSRKAILTTQWNGGMKIMKKRLKLILKPSKNKNGLALVALTLVLLLAAGSCMACGAKVLAAGPADTAGDAADIPEDQTEQGQGEVELTELNPEVELPDHDPASEEEEKITQAALTFFYAWVDGDQDEIKRCTADIADSYPYPVGTAADDGYDSAKITDVSVKEIVHVLFPDTIAAANIADVSVKEMQFDAGDKAVVSVEFRAAAEDDYLQYMNIELVKRGGDWKVYGAGLEM